MGYDANGFRSSIYTDLIWNIAAILLVAIINIVRITE